MKEILDQHAHFLRDDVTSWCRTSSHTTAQRCDVNVSEFRRKLVSQRHSWGSKNSFAAVPMNWVTLVSSFCESALREAASGRGKWALSSLDRGGACLEVHQSGFRTLWRVHRSWSLAIPAAFRTPVSHEIVSSVAIFSLASWLRDVPSLSLLTPFSFHCLLHPAEARQLRRCEVDNGSLSTRYENVYGIVNISEPKDAQNLCSTCFWKRPGICQLMNTMQSPVPHHRLDTTIWKLTAAQHFACFKRQLRRPRRVASASNAPRTSQRWRY